MTVQTIALDHLAFLSDRPYRRQALIGLRRLARSRGSSRFSYLDVWHEADGSCCQLEDWSQTAARIYAALVADGTPTVYLGLQRQGG